MKPRRGAEDTLCPIARSLAVVGDRWTMLILRELFMGSVRFDAIQAQTGASPQMLAARLKQLEIDGMVARVAYSLRPLRHEYRLTAKGRDFYPVIYALRAWGETWCKSPDDESAVRFTHRQCGTDVGLGTFCTACGAAVKPTDLNARLSLSFKRERAKRRAHGSSG
jgi:DNA-binding HxlR family transcriptional regulator